MASLVGNLMIKFIRKFANVNPERVEDQLAGIKKLNLLNKNKTPKGCVKKCEVTPTGTKYERIFKKGFVKNGKVLLFLHGGAYIGVLSDTYRNLTAKFSEAMGGCECIFIEYDCAPEFKYPTQQNQALDLWHDLVENQGYNPKNIIVGGDSAGGNLTLNLLLNLRDRCETLPKAAFCWSPWADMLGKGDSYVFNYSEDCMFGNKGGFITDEKRVHLLDSAIYSFAENADRSSPYVSPVYGEYHDFPPMLFTVGSHEMLLSDTMTIVGNLKKHKVPVELIVGDKMFHIYPLFHSFLPEGKVALGKTSDFIKKNINS